ncbi:MAG: YjgN family protein [Cytophagaceae bacterium]|nr:YjgN family protein [Cytophagaceae bacterium]MDW8455289.1 DUF898 family protein [Cytophagaceae bacterium]
MTSSKVDLTNARKVFHYHGQVKDYFGIYIVNVLLTIVTLGFYYPWAKAAIMRFHYNNLEFLGSRFSFHGTGNEMVRGMLMSFAVIVLPFFLINMAIDAGYLYEGLTIMGIYFLSLVFTIPLALVGTMRYRCSRSSWRGVFFSNSSNYKEILAEFAKGIFLMIITLGIYRVWMQNKIMRKLIDATRFGNIQFKYTAEGIKMFELNFLGAILVSLSLYIYYFKWRANIYNYFFNNIRMIQGEKIGTLRANITGWDFFKLSFVNALIILFSLGIATPWAVIRRYNFFANHVYVMANIDFDEVTQVDRFNMGGSIGEAMMDEMDLSLLY